MEGKAAAGTQLTSAVAPAVAAPSMHEEEAIASMEMEQQRGWMRGTTALAWRQWASIKSKARAAGGYAVLRTRQGITMSMFGEPKIEPLVKDPRAHKQPQ